MSVFLAIDSYIKSLSDLAEGAPGLNEFLLRVLPFVCDAVGVEAASIFLADRAEQRLYLAATTGIAIDSPSHEIVYSFGEGLTGRVAQSRRSIFVTDVQQDPRWSGKYRETISRNPVRFLAAPMLWYGSEVVGVVRCVSAVPVGDGEATETIRDLELITALLTPYVIAVRADEERRNTIERVTHELKASLVAIKSSAHMICHEEQQLRTESRKRIDDIINICDMVMTSVETKSLAVGRSIITHLRASLMFQDILVPVIRMLQPTFESHQLQVWVDDDVRAGSAIVVDPHLLRLVVFNLLDNAAKYSKVRSEIRIAGAMTHMFYRLTISNWGLAIDEHDAERIFLSGYRSRSAMQRNVAGQGLGLYTCRMIIERLGGKISLASRSSPTSFSVEIPTNMESEVGT
jgi:signal transduction histidine kinase